MHKILIYIIPATKRSFSHFRKAENFIDVCLKFEMISERVEPIFIDKYFRIYYQYNRCCGREYLLLNNKYVDYV